MKEDRFDDGYDRPLPVRSPCWPMALAAAGVALLYAMAFVVDRTPDDGVYHPGIGGGIRAILIGVGGACGMLALIASLAWAAYASREDET